MTKLLNIQTSQDVKFASPWIIAEGFKPHRIVIRDLGEIATVDEIHEYVVHDEILTENEGDSIGATSQALQRLIIEPAPPGS